MMLAVQSLHRNKENIIDPTLERTDPTPCIYELFRQFNKKFFWDSLNMVIVSWSGRQMTSCAGVCSFHPRSKECHIRLSAPLLSLRPRKDLVETLLHEMIHAYLFVTCNNREREDHGPEFHKHMYRINQAAGTNISVYHTFRDEVRHYQGHVWRCDGPCQKRAPFYGIVRRATNRAPGPNDRWWEQHRTECSGTFQKIEEPAGYKSKKPAVRKDNKKIPPNDMRNFFPPSGAKIHTVADQKNTPGKQASFPTISNNIHTFGGGRTTGKPGQHTLGAKGSCSKGSGSSGGTKLNSRGSNTVVVRGKPATSTSVAPPASPKPPPLPPRPPNPSTTSSTSARDHVRNVWANKFSDSSVASWPGKHGNGQKRPMVDTSGHSKKLKTEDIVTECAICEAFVPENQMANHLRTCGNTAPSASASGSSSQSCPVCNKPFRNSLEEHLSSCLENSMTEDFFATDEVIVPGSAQSDVEASDSNHLPCPVCNKPVRNGSLETHLSNCLEDSISDDFFSQTREETPVNELNCFVTCPICLKIIPDRGINNHIDNCLTSEALKSGCFLNS